MTLAKAVADTLAALDEHAADAAVRELAVSYARAVDRAEAEGRAAGEVMARLSKDEDPDAWEAVEALRAQLSARQALVQLGSRLEATLVLLQAVPKTRPAKPTAPQGNGVLERMRQAAAAGATPLRAV